MTTIRPIFYVETSPIQPPPPPRVVWHSGKDIRPTLELYRGEYDSVYISLGGKYNAPTVVFSNPAYLAGHEFPTNTQYQMFPMFTRFPKTRDSRCLVLIVDDFANDEVREINQAFVDSATAQFDHLDVVLYDTTLHIRDIRPFTQAIVEWASSRAITPEKCIIANYIRFRGGLNIETAQLELDIPRTIQNVLNETKTYAGCLYQWFGYQYYTYNLLYAYSKYDVSRHLKVIMLFHECAEATQVVSGNASRLFMFHIAREPQNKNVLMAFLQHTLDITSYAKSNEVMSSKMIEFCNTDWLETPSIFSQ